MPASIHPLPDNIHSACMPSRPATHSHTLDWRVMPGLPSIHALAGLDPASNAIHWPVSAGLSRQSCLNSYVLYATLHHLPQEGSLQSSRPLPSTSRPPPVPSPSAPPLSSTPPRPRQHPPLFFCTSADPIAYAVLRGSLILPTPVSAYATAFFVKLSLRVCAKVCPRLRLRLPQYVLIVSHYRRARLTRSGHPRVLGRMAGCTICEYYPYR